MGGVKYCKLLRVTKAEHRKFTTASKPRSKKKSRNSSLTVKCCFAASRKHMHSLKFPCCNIAVFVFSFEVTYMFQRFVTVNRRSVTVVAFLDVAFRFSLVTE